MARNGRIHWLSGVRFVRSGPSATVLTARKYGPLRWATSLRPAVSAEARQPTSGPTRAARSAFARHASTVEARRGNSSSAQRRHGLTHGRGRLSGDDAARSAATGAGGRCPIAVRRVGGWWPWSRSGPSASRGVTGPHTFIADALTRAHLAVGDAGGSWLCPRVVGHVRAEPGQDSNSTPLVPSRPWHCLRCLSTPRRTISWPSCRG